MDSPFRPGFGKTPPYLAGRSDAITRIRHGLEVGQWPLERGILISGFRGVGKTVLLNQAEDLAREAGWRVIPETASPGFFERITSVHLPRLLGELEPKRRFRVTDASIAALGSIGIEYPDGHTAQPTFRTMTERVCQLLAPRGGLLFTVDEISGAVLDDINRFASEYQHAVREDREVAFIAAGVRGELRTLLRKGSTTFLRRCADLPIEMLGVADTTEAFRRPIEENGRIVAPSTLDHMVRASQGYPFLVQQIGDLAWRHRPDSREIDAEAAAHGYRVARQNLGGFIFEPTLSGLSDMDREFLAAMAEDDGPSDIDAILGRLHRTPSYISVYRARLIDAGLITPAGWGKVTMALPYLREYLREYLTPRLEAVQELAEFPPPPED